MKTATEFNFFFESRKQAFKPLNGNTKEQPTNYKTEDLQQLAKEITLFIS